MAAVIKMVIILLVCNIFVYIGINMISGLPDSSGESYRLNQNLTWHFDNDLIEQWLGSQVEVDQIIRDTNDGYINYNINFSGGVSSLPQKQSGGIGGLTTFIDVVDTVWGVVAMLGNIVVAPLTLFFNYRMPVLIGLMVGLPYAICLFLGIVWFIRGMPS